MNRLCRIALVAVLVGLTACASPRTESDQTAEAPSVEMAPMPLPGPAPFVSDFDKMRAALPTFQLERSQRADVSVIRDLGFETDSSILSRTEVARLAPLQIYLRANPLIAVRIEGNGDGASATERNASLSRDRAEAVVRALLVDTKIANAMVAAAATMPQSRDRHRNVEITFVNPAIQNGDQARR